MRLREEIDFLRLLHKCQEDTKSWRLEKYVDSLGMILDKLRNQLPRDTLEEYGRKVESLRGLIETDQLPSAAELLAPDTKTSLVTNKHQQIRQELLLSNRRRQTEDLDEEITKNIIELTQNLRDNMQAAHSIIQRDNETLSRVATKADAASSKMQKNTDKMDEFVKKGCQCGIWVALVIVTLTFLMMVIFIRLFPNNARMTQSIKDI